MCNRYFKYSFNKIKTFYRSIPGMINSRCGQVVTIMQRWDGQRPAINYLLRYFRRWLIDANSYNLGILIEHAPRPQIQLKSGWIEKLLQTPLVDYRKFVMWCIVTCSNGISWSFRKRHLNESLLINGQNEF